MTMSANDMAAQPTYVCPCETHGSAGSRHDRIGPAYLSIQHWQDRARLIAKWPELDISLHTFPVLNNLLDRILPGGASLNSKYRLPACESDFSTSREKRTTLHFHDHQAMVLRNVDEDSIGPHRKTYDSQTDFFSTYLFLHPAFGVKIACVGQGKKPLLSQRGAKMHLLLILISGRVELPPEIVDNINKLDLPPAPPHIPPQPVGHRPEFLPGSESDLFTVTRLRAKYAAEVTALVKAGFDFAKHSPLVLLKLLQIPFPHVGFSNAGSTSWMVTVTTAHVICSGNGVEVANAMEAAIFHLVLLAVRGIEPSAINDIKAGKVSTEWKPEWDLDHIFGNDRNNIFDNDRKPPIGPHDRSYIGTGAGSGSNKRDMSRDRRRRSRSRSQSRSRTRRHPRGSRSRSRSRDRRSARRSRSRDRSRRTSRSRSRSRSRDRAHGHGRRDSKRARSRSRSRSMDRRAKAPNAGPAMRAVQNPLLPLQQPMPMPMKPAAAAAGPAHAPAPAPAVPGIPDIAMLPTSAKLAHELSALPMELRALIAGHPMAGMWAADPVRAMRMWVWSATGKDVVGDAAGKGAGAVQLNRTGDGFFVIATVRVPGGDEVQEVAPSEHEAVARVTVRVIVNHKA